MGAFRLSGLPKLKLFHVDGGSGVQLISEPDNLKTLGCAVSPGGRYLWYSRRTGDWKYNARLPQYQLEAYDVETGERYPGSSGYGSVLRPTLSPDGRWLVFGTRRDEHTGWCCATWRRGRSAGCPSRCRTTTRSRGRPWTCCRACRSRPTRATSASWGGGLWKVRAGRPRRSRSGALRPDAGVQGRVRLSHRAVARRRAHRVHRPRPPAGEIDARTLRRGQWFGDGQHVFERHARFVRDLVEARAASAWAATGEPGEFPTGFRTTS